MVDYSNFSSNEIERAASEVPDSKSQIYQDLFVLMFLGFKEDGYFVEFGATDGLRFSNTYLLEKKYGWKGVLVEPAKIWQSSLFENRRCKIDTRCVWAESNKLLMFNETTIGELSTLQYLSDRDMHADARKSGNHYYVETVSLNDLLKEHNSPDFIDYLSIDTEGSEFEILSTLNFDKYRFGFISCEHNFTSVRDQIFELLSAQGYIRVFPEKSEFDDWYIHSSLV
jgi:FkbM family methyltransferase